MRRFAARRRLEYAEKLHATASGRPLGDGGFTSAEKSRDAHSYNTSRLSPDSALEEGSEEMLLRSDSMYKNYELGRGFVEGNGLRRVGCGMIPSPSIRAVVGEITEDQASQWNRILRETFEVVSKRIGKHREQFAQIQWICSRDFDRKGEYFLLFGDKTDPLSPLSLKVEVISPRRVGTPPDKEGNRWVRMGIQLNEDGVAIGAHVKDVQPGDTVEYEETYTYYPFELANGLPRLLHVFDKIEDGQHRGYPAMQVGAKRVKNSSELDEAEIERNWASSCLVGIVSSELDADMAMAERGVKREDGKRLQGMSPGRYEYINPDETIEFNNPHQTQQSYMPFQEHQGRMFGAGVCTPYELLSGDWRGVTYSAGKIIVNGDEALTERGQQFVAIGVEATWQHIVTRAITGGLLPGASQVLYRANPWAYWRMNIIPPKRRSIDPAREQRTEHGKIEAGALPVQDYIEQVSGRPAEEVLEAAKRGREMLRSAGFIEHMPQMGRDQLSGSGESNRPPTQPGDDNPESSDANQNQPVNA